jgi:hypothetical protein
MFRGNQPDGLDRYYPVRPRETFMALDQAVRRRFRMKSSDDLALACTFSSGVSAFTWGENFSAQGCARRYRVSYPSGCGRPGKTARLCKASAATSS